jgi:beta-glucosidase
LKRGGFEKRSNVRYFVRFAEKIVSELGSSVRFIITVNEPEIYALNSYYHQEWPPMVVSKIKTVQVILNLGLAHRKVVKIIHKMSRRYKVAIAKSSSYIYPGDDSLISRISAFVKRFLMEDLVLLCFIKNSDFLGVNFYQSDRF